VARNSTRPLGSHLWGGSARDDAGRMMSRSASSRHRCRVTICLPHGRNCRFEYGNGRRESVHTAITTSGTAHPMLNPRLRFELWLRPEDVSAEFERADMAHETISPTRSRRTSGRGMCSGIRDPTNLAWK